MKVIIFISLLISSLFSDLFPLSKKNILKDRDNEFERGTYLIVLSNSDLNNTILTYFTNLKKTQGYDVEVVSFRESDGDIYAIEGETNNDLKDYLMDYYANDSMLEYVLLVGDVNQNNDDYNIPTFEIPSYSFVENDQTDYPYTFFDIGDGEDALDPHFFIGRWSIGSSTDLVNIINRNIHYAQLNETYIPDPTYLNNALVVAGNYSGEGNPPSMWPVTPVWTSKWLLEEFNYFGYENVDSAFFHQHNYTWGTNPEPIEEAWNNGVGVINYRGWGDSRGWHKPQFRLDEINDLLNPSFSLPVVFSFVCNTGDFGNEQQVFCFGETLLTAGTINAPKGAVAMIGPSDLDTDTRFNNVICGALWDGLLEGRQDELAPALHVGKQALINEFGEGYEITGPGGTSNLAEFYHHVYGVLGDPSLSVWLKVPEIMSASIGDVHSINNSFLNLVINDIETGEALQDVVGALLFEGELIAKGLSNEHGQLDIDFDAEVGSEFTLYLNKGQYYQKEYTIIFENDNEDSFVQNEYNPDDTILDYGYDFEIYDITESDWIEISETGNNLFLTDDSDTTVQMIYNNGNIFSFQYYGQEFDSLTVSSNGWASFLRCLDGRQETPENVPCESISHFFNNSITFPIGPYGLLAPFYDDLDDNGGTEPLHVYHKAFDEESMYVVQWNNIANGQQDEYCIDNSVGDINEDFSVDILDIVMLVNIVLGIEQVLPNQEPVADCNQDGNIDVFDIILAINLSLNAIPDPENCVKETFQLILINNPNDDGEIIFQYKDIQDIDDHGVTIGIEDPSKDQGIEIQFNGETGDPGSSLMENYKAIRFYIP